MHAQLLRRPAPDPSWRVVCSSRSLDPGTARPAGLGDEVWTLFRSWSGTVGLVHRGDERRMPPPLRESHGLVLVGDRYATDDPIDLLEPLRTRQLVYRGSRPTRHPPHGREHRWTTIPLGPLGEVALLHTRGTAGPAVHWWSTPWTAPGTLACAISQIPEELRWSPLLPLRRLALARG